MKSESPRERGLREFQFYEAVYEQADVVELAHVSKASLQNWVNRNVITVADARPGKARNRKYAKFDVGVIALTNALIRIGIELSHAAKMAADSIDMISDETGERGIRKVARYLQDYFVLWEPGAREYHGTLCRRSDIGKRDFDSGPCVLLPVGEMLAKLIEAMMQRELKAKQRSAKSGSER